VKDREWVFSNAGGAMGMFTILHASISEYIIVFGTPIGTEGHSGRYWAEDYFMILEGEQWAYGEGDLERHVYRPGDLHVLPKGTARGYRMPDRCFALEYCRGAIPTMLPFGLADVLSSTLDLPCLLQTFRMYGKAVTGNLLRGKI
jgi:C-8 sterol isomerase